MLQLGKSKVFGLLVYAFIVLFILYNTKKLTGFSFSQTLRDIPSWVTALSFLGLLDIFFRLNNKIPNWLLSLQFYILFSIWAYIAYHFLVYESYQFSDLPGDVSNSIKWVKDNPLRLVLWAAIMTFIAAIGPLNNIVDQAFSAPSQTTGRKWLHDKKDS